MSGEALLRSLTLTVPTGADAYPHLRRRSVMDGLGQTRVVLLAGRDTRVLNANRDTPGDDLIPLAVSPWVHSLSHSDMYT